jgi:SAM-dependent methyltransferase
LLASIMMVPSSRMIAFSDPRDGRPLRPEGGRLVAEDGAAFPIVDGIPRFVASEGYAASFGLEWTIHTKTQLDSHTGENISRSRLERCLGGPITTVSGMTVLEAGCGAGRFTELLVAAGGLVHSIDMSRAVDANRHNIGGPPNYLIAQADLLMPPFPPASFDLVVCLGVLQHTPSPEASIAALWRHVKPGGQLVIDHYAWSFSRATRVVDQTLRLVLKRIPPSSARRATDGLVRLFFPIHWAARGSRLAQIALSRISPVYVYFDALPQLSRDEHLEWAQLDAFDHLTDRYERLRTPHQVTRTLTALGAVDLCVAKGGNGVEARCRKPSSARLRSTSGDH